MLHVEFLQCRQHIRILYSYIVYTLMDLTPAGLNKIQNSETVVEKGSFWKTLLSWTLKDTLTSPKKRENKQFKKKKNMLWTENVHLFGCFSNKGWAN